MEMASETSAPYFAESTDRRYADRLGTTRGAIYKTLHDARAKLRHALEESGHTDGGVAQ